MLSERLRYSPLLSRDDIETLMRTAMLRLDVDGCKHVSMDQIVEAFRAQIAFEIRGCAQVIADEEKMPPWIRADRRRKSKAGE